MNYKLIAIKFNIVVLNFHIKNDENLMQIILLRCVHVQYMYYDHEIMRGLRGGRGLFIVCQYAISSHSKHVSCNTNSDGNYDYSALVMTVLSAEM